MKIIYIANVRLPTEKAHGVQIMKMCEAFANLGNEVELVVARRFNQKLKDFDVFSYYNINNRFKIKRIFSLDVVPLNLSRFFGPLGVWLQNTSFAFFSFFYLIRKKTDIFYSRDEFSIFLLSYFRKNIIFEAHIYPGSKSLLYKRLFNRINGIVVINNKLKDLFINSGIAKEKLIVAPDGVDIKFFDFKKNQTDCRLQLKLPLDKKIILYSGHLFRWKGVYTLAEASRYMDNQSMIMFVGGMDYDINRLKKYIVSNGLRNIEVLGYQSHLLIPAFLKAADVLVLPNSAKKDISKLYTSPLKLFEYMASKRPVVASNLPSLTEILNEDNSVLVEPDEPKALSEGILRVLSSKDFGQKIADQAFLDVQKYDWQKRAKNILLSLKVR